MCASRWTCDRVGHRSLERGGTDPTHGVSCFSFQPPFRPPAASCVCACVRACSVAASPALLVCALQAPCVRHARTCAWPPAASRAPLDGVAQRAAGAAQRCLHEEVVVVADFIEKVFEVAHLVFTEQQGCYQAAHGRVAPALICSAISARKGHTLAKFAILCMASTTPQPQNARVQGWCTQAHILATSKHLLPHFVYLSK